MPRPRQVIQSYKQVKNVAPVSRVAATQINTTLATGVDNYTGPSAANEEVPTGAIIKNFDIQIGAMNLVGVASFFWVTVQLLRSGQSATPGRAQGGDPQRNQVFLTIQRTMGDNQNTNIPIKFKVPRKFQRIREGDIWIVTTECNQIYTEAIQIIYKFYR